MAQGFLRLAADSYDGVKHLTSPNWKNHGKFLKQLSYMNWL